jgi:triacylglycerol esterase/lipase EstA (alpha/beta hydrolase family)
VSPRRRLFAIALLLGAVAGTLALVLAAVLGGTTHPSVPQARPGPVLVIPGYGGSPGSVAPLADRLRAEGRTVVVVRLPGRGTGDLRGQAEAVRAAARSALRDTGASSVDLVGYSAGGVVARIYVRDLGGRDVVRRVVTLGSPHHGAELASLAGALSPENCPTGCRQLAPGSQLLTELNAGDETPDGPRWVSLWTTRDGVVTPPESARLEGAVDVALQDVCRDDASGHSDLPRDPLVLGIVVRALSPAEPAAPTAPDCAALRAAGVRT